MLRRLCDMVSVGVWRFGIESAVSISRDGTRIIGRYEYWVIDTIQVL